MYASLAVRSNDAFRPFLQRITTIITMIISMPNMTTTAPSTPPIIFICGCKLSTSIGCGCVELSVVYMYVCDVFSVVIVTVVVCGESVEYGFIITVVVIDSACVVGFTGGLLGLMTVTGLTKFNIVVLLGLRIGFINAVVINSSHVVGFTEGLLGMITWRYGTMNQIK